jgi:hypothetical protein
LLAQRRSRACAQARIARQQGFIRLQFARFQQAGIGRHPVALFQHEYVAGNHFAPGNPHGLAITDHQRARRGKVAQGFQHVSVRVS